MKILRELKNIFYRKKVRGNYMYTRILFFTKKERYVANINQYPLKNSGRCTYCGGPHVHIASPETRIGSFCSIGDNVTIGHGEHPLDMLSTSPYMYYDWCGWKNLDMPSHDEFARLSPCSIGNDVWIGSNVFIKNGIKISDGAVIGAGSVVTKDVPPYAIVVGVPAKVLRYRFDEKTISELLSLRWWDLDDDVIRSIPYDNMDKAMAYLREIRKDTFHQNDLISIIVPVYNGAEFLPGLINSLQKQTYKNFEVLFIDDFSTDASADLIESLSKEDARFRLIHRETKGGTAAKGIEYGLPLCRGSYYFYLSQDDFIDADCLEKCHTKSVETGADVVCCNTVLYYGENDKNNPFRYPVNKNYGQILSSREAFYESLTWHLHGANLKKMSLVKKLGFEASYYNSCEFYNRIAYLYANKIAFADTNFYYRQDNPNAITKSIKYFTIDVLATDIMLFEFLIKEKFPIKQIRRRLNSLQRTLFRWQRQFSKIDLSENERAYVLNTLEKSRRKLLPLSFKYFCFSKIFKMCRKIEKL